MATRFCHDCGQENTSYRVSLGRLVGDLFEEVFQLESRLWRTLWTLIRKPGLLTREYNAGRRVWYTTPLRLYLLSSFVFFFVAAVMPPRADSLAQVRIDLQENQVRTSRSSTMAPAFARWIDKRVRERLGITDKLDPAEVNRRSREIFIANVPKVLAVLVPLFALILMLFFRRPKLYFVEHLVFALHLHATAFLLLLVSDLLRWPPVGFVTTLAFLVVGFLGARARSVSAGARQDAVQARVRRHRLRHRARHRHPRRRRLRPVVEG